jgi:hypothetical protein
MTEFNFDRAQKEEHLIDALGKKWTVVVNKQNGLCHTRPEPDREDAVIPKNIAGQWTKPTLLMEQIKLYVSSTWDKAEEVAAKNARQVQAAKELEDGEAKKAEVKAQEQSEEQASKVSKKAPAKTQKRRTTKAD